MKRRNFLKILAPAGITPFMVNGFPVRAFANQKLANLLNNCEGIDERVLVLIQLKGGNDGLNTLIPIPQYDTYANLRPFIKVPDTGANKFIELDSSLKASRQIGLHPAMSDFKAMYEDGLLNVVQGVGYTEINQSHFKSTDLWLTGGDGTPDNFNIGSGWMGRTLQAFYPDVAGAPTPDMPDPIGIQVGGASPSVGFHTETEHQNAINLSGQDPAGFFSLIQTIGGAPILNVPDSEHGDELRYIMGVEQSVNLYAQRITEVFNAGNNIGTYPDSDLANQLKTIARLVSGGSKTKIYLCSLSGFDTHSAQIFSGDISLGDHNDLLKTLSEAVRAFTTDIQALGIEDRIMGATFSEFGRCARENGSFGTDHGTLAPMFIFGKNVLPGVSGTNLNLSNLTDDSQVQNMQFDYRQVFATMIQDWLGANNWVMEQSLFQGFAKMPLLQPNAVVDPQCYLGGTLTIDDGGFLRPNNLHIYPNPARHFARANFNSEREFEGILTINDLSGRIIYQKQAHMYSGENTFELDVMAYPSGTLVVRLEDKASGSASVTKMVVKR